MAASRSAHGSALLAGELRRKQAVVLEEGEGKGRALAALVLWPLSTIGPGLRVSDTPHPPPSSFSSLFPVPSFPPLLFLSLPSVFFAFLWWGNF